jgi:hypothetical protein
MPLPTKNSTTTINPSYQGTNPSAQNCCRLMNFERPYYFAGHLLTDTDLLLEQQYVREQRRLHNRSVHGAGTVCGLRLTCDPNSTGGILVGPGYAIDNCGNDLVVPARQPLDVIGVLSQKGLILTETAQDPCDPGNPKSESNFKQCFYVTICYQEEQSDFATPLVTTSQTTSSECEPTRILETVSLDVVDTLPATQPKHSALKHRLEKCFKIFSEGAFAQALQTHRKRLSQIVNPEESHKPLEHHAEYEKLFFELRGLLLLYLNRNPDRYNPTIEEEIRRVRFPEIHRHSEKAQERYLEELRDSFSALLGLAWRHAVSCALGELVPACNQVSEASCLSLGAVVVENGRIVRVCNYPRHYVWSTANFHEVVMAITLGELACGKRPEQNGGAENDEERICCGDFNFDLGCLLQWLEVNSKAPFYAATELLRWFETFPQSVREGFDFTDPCNFSPKIFQGTDENKAIEILKAAMIQTRVAEAPLESKAPDLFALLQAAGLGTGEEPVVLAVKDQQVAGAAIEHLEILNEINKLQTQISNLKAQVERLQSRRQSGSQGGA